MVWNRARAQRRKAARKALLPLLLANFAVTLGIAYQYVLQVPELSGPSEYVFLHLAWISNFVLLYLAVGLVLSAVLLCFPGKRTFVLLTTVVFGALQLFTVVDAAIYRIFRFHFNGMVWNLFRTEGAWDSVRVGSYTLAFGGALLLGFVAFELLAASRSYRWALQVGGASGKWARWLVLTGCLVVVSDKVIYAAADIHDNLAVLRFSKVFPLYQPFTAKRFVERVFGYKPQRDSVDFGGRRGNGLDYPKEPLTRGTAGSTPNILWIVVDAWRYDMLSPEVTPHTWAFAQRSLVFQKHYSGGNASRFGVFSMFYGLYGYYWHQFLAERQSPVFLDELARLGYDFKILSSTRLTYPEFRRTAFVRIPEAVEDELGGEDAAVKDPKLAKRFLEWLELRDPGKPFFSFLFFDAPHGPYSYPDAFDRFVPSRKTANYVTVGERDMLPLKNSYRNAIHFDDHLIGEILRALEKRGFLSNTVVLISGDHGEEFFESGYYGHTSAFSREQTGVPLVLYVPGREHERIEYRTSHLDLVPTMMELLGYTTPPGAFSAGKSLLDGKGHDFVVSSGWDDGAIIDEAGVIVFSTETYKASRFEVRDPDYRLVEDGRQRLPGQARQLAAVAEGFRRFLK
jgi:uncharacterized protein